MVERRKGAIRGVVKNECAFCAIQSNLADVTRVFEDDNIRVSRPPAAASRVCLLVTKFLGIGTWLQRIQFRLLFAINEGLMKHAKESAEGQNRQQILLFSLRALY